MNTKELTIKQRKFVAEYIKDGNASRAYSVAYKVLGNTAEVSGSKLLRNPKVADEIKAQRSSLSKQLESSTKVTVERVVNELAKGAFAELHIADMKFSDKIKCLELLAKTLGMLDGNTKPQEDPKAVREKLQAAIDATFATKQ